MFSKSNLEKFCCIYKQIQRENALETTEQLIQVTKPCFTGNVSLLEKWDVIKHFLVNDSFSQLFNGDRCTTNECSTTTSSPNILYVIFWVLLLILITCSNLLVIVSVTRVKFLRTNVANLFILSLAVSDLFVGLFVVPVKIKHALHNRRFCASMTVCRFYLTTDMTFFSTSVTNLFVIAVDRYIALNYPYKYPSLVTRKRAIAVIVSTWSYGMAWGFLGNFKWDNPSDAAMVIEHYTCTSNQNLYFLFSMFILVFFIPVIAMGAIYLRILMIARRHALGIAIATSTGNNNHQDSIDTLLSPQNEVYSPVIPASPSPILRIKNYLNAEIAKSRSSSTSSSVKNHIMQYRKMVFKASKTVATVYGAFVVTWSPLWFISIALVVCETCLRENYTTWYNVIFVELLPILGSMANPCIYAMMNKQYRKAFRMILKVDFISKAFGGFKGQRPRTTTENAIL